MSTENLLNTFDDVKHLYLKIQFELHDLIKSISLEMVKVPFSQFEAENSTMCNTINHQIHKGIVLLKLNKQILDDSADSILVKSGHSTLEFLVDYDKYLERFNDLQTRLRQVRLSLEEKNSAIIESQRKEILFGYQQQDKADNSNTEKEQREALFSNRTQDIDALSSNQKVLKTNESITSVLQNTYGIMESNVISSDLIVESFSDSTNTLLRLNDRYEFLSSTLLSSRNLVQELQKADVSDLRKMKLALGWFGICCCWVLWRRIFKYPTYLLIWVMWNLFKSTVYVFRYFKKANDKGVLIPPFAAESNPGFSESIDYLSEAPLIDSAVADGPSFSDYEEASRLVDEIVNSVHLKGEPVPEEAPAEETQKSESSVVEPEIVMVEEEDRLPEAEDRLPEAEEGAEVAEKTQEKASDDDTGLPVETLLKDEL